MTGGVREWALWELPRRAVAWIVFVVLLWVVSLGCAFVFRGSPGGKWQLFLVLGSVGVAQTARATIRIGRPESDGAEVAGYSSDVWIMALAVLAPSWAVLAVAMLWTVGVNRCDHIWRGSHRGTSPHQEVFNAVQCALCALAAHLMFTVASGVHPGSLRTLLALLTAAGTYLAGNAVIVCVVVSLASGQSLRVVFRAAWVSIQGVTTVCGLLLGFVWLRSPWVALLVFPLVDGLHRSTLHKWLLEQSRMDAKTGLANAGFWRQTAEATVARAGAGGPGCAVLVVDLDFFKRVNDTHGHLIGDEVLREVAVRLSAAVRPGDMVGRFGGEEFTVLLPGASVEAAAVVAERIREGLAIAPVSVSGGLLLAVTCSVGVAGVVAGQAQALAGVLELADRAVYEAKDTGRNRVAVAAG